MSKLIKGRGSNPNSHGNNKKLNPAIRKEVWLTPEEWEQAKAMGEGNYSKGMRSLLPHLAKAKLAIELLLNNHPQAAEYAEGVLIELEDLEIENLYEEAYADGIIEKPKGGAYII